MSPDVIEVPAELKGHVNCILVFRGENTTRLTQLPFYADGYPGIIYKESGHPAIRLPDGKPIADFFAYGQTIAPMELQLEGAFDMIVFQLFPFSLIHLFGLDPQCLNDDCSDLRELPLNTGLDAFNLLKQSTGTREKIEILSAFICTLADNSGNIDQRIRKSVELILEGKGKIPIKEVQEAVNVSERTFQRQFRLQIGMSAKKFAKIIQFQHTYSGLIEDKGQAIPELVFANGFTDQAHFIKTIKSYTGETPSAHRKKFQS